MTENLSNLKALKLVSLPPLRIDTDPHDYWVDVNPGFPPFVCDLYFRYPETESKLENAGFFRPDQFATLSLENLSKRAGLTDLETEDLSQALQNRKITLPVFGDLTPDEMLKKQKNELSSEIALLHNLSESGSAQATLYLAKLADHRLVDGNEEEFYEGAIIQGSGQAANDLAVKLYNRKTHFRDTHNRILSLFELADKLGIKEAKNNLKIAYISFTT